MVRWFRWHCPPDTCFEIRALAVWGRARYLSVTEAPHNTDFHTWMGKKHFCFFQTAETGNRTPNSGVKGSGANHYPRAPAPPMTNWLTKPPPRKSAVKRQKRGEVWKTATLRPAQLVHVPAANCLLPSSGAVCVWLGYIHNVLETARRMQMYVVRGRVINVGLCRLRSVSWWKQHSRWARTSRQ